MPRSWHWLWGRVVTQSSAFLLARHLRQAALHLPYSNGGHVLILHCLPEGFCAPAVFSGVQRAGCELTGVRIGRENNVFGFAGVLLCLYLDFPSAPRTWHRSQRCGWNVRRACRGQCEGGLFALLCIGYQPI